MTTQDNTEEKILEAAKSVFIRKGMDGARMQEIADEAGINKALVHYYFRSKDRLFKAVFQIAFQFFIPRMIEKFQTEMPFFEKIRFFVKTYTEMIDANPYIPVFIMNEINRDPKGLLSIILKAGINPALLLSIFEKAKQEGLIKDIDPREFVLNLIGLCVFPYVARPLAQPIFFNGDKAAYDQMLKRRQTELAELLINSIKA